MTLSLENIDIHTPQRYAKKGFPWEEWDLLRRDAPIFWYERDDIEPFWAVTRHADVLTISGLPEVFINGGPRLRLALLRRVPRRLLRRKFGRLHVHFVELLQRRRLLLRGTDRRR